MIVNKVGIPKHITKLRRDRERMCNIVTEIRHCDMRTTGGIKPMYRYATPGTDETAIRA